MTAAGSGSCNLTEPAYKARLSYIAGGNIQIDAVVSQSFIPAEMHSWGMIKDIYSE